MMPLLGLNRNLVFHGLRSLRLSPSPGIKKLAEVSGVKLNEISAYHLGFIFGPRINAVGRLSNPTDALRLLCAPNLITAGKYAKILDEYNKDRQILQKDSLDLADNLTSDTLKSDKLIFVSDPSYHPGIIGLIAGQLKEKYYLPTVAISENGDIARGSCRSVPQLNIIEALRQFSDLFIDLGGHSQQPALV
jgi:single-stranded-DNA-specific exonuclease